MTTEQNKAYQEAVVFGWQYSHMNGKNVVMELFEVINDLVSKVGEAEILEDGSQQINFRNVPCRYTGNP